MIHYKHILVGFICSISWFFPGEILADDLGQANTYYARYEYKLAIDIYEKLMAKRPSVDIAQKLANCYRFINHTEKAELAYQRVLTFNRFDPVNFKYYADMLKQNGKYELARENYLLYAKYSPDLKKEAEDFANSCEEAKRWIENPDKSIQLINEDAINTSYAEFSPVYLKGDFYFVSDRQLSNDTKSISGWTGNPFLKVFQFSENSIRALPAVINAKYHNGPATLSSKGDTIYFTRTELPVPSKEKLAIGHNEIWVSVKRGETWGEAKNIFSNKNLSYSVQHPALSTDGTILYFASDKPGGFGKMDIYAMRKRPNGTWGEPVNCGKGVNSAEDDVFPYISPDGKLYFASKRHAGMGGLDIFFTRGAFDNFTIAENLRAPYNSPKDDFGICFTSDSSGYVSSNRNGGKGLDDIYQFKTIPIQLEKNVYALEGEVVDKLSREPLRDSKIRLTNQLTGTRVEIVTGGNGKFRFDLDANTDYLINGSKEKYFSGTEDSISTKNIQKSKLFKVVIELERAENSYLVRLENIYYDFDKYNIRPDAAIELDRVYAFLKANPDVTIQLRSHTDARGSAVYNKWLSQKRAESALRYLLEKGIEKHRMSAVGFGETEVLNRCKDNVACTEAEHQFNRRTELKVIRKK